MTGFGSLELIEHIQLVNEDLKAVNTARSGEGCSLEGRTRALLCFLKHSWNVIRYKLR